MSSIHDAGFLSEEIKEWIQKHRKENEKWFSLSERCSKLGQEVLLSIKVNNNDLQKILVSLWFNRLLSHFQAIVLLMERGMLYEAQILLRTLVEVSFSLVSVAENPDIAQDFLKDDKVQQLKALNTYMNLPKNLRVQDEQQEAGIRKLIDDLKCEICKNKYKELKTEFIAQKAKMSDYYNTIYASLCSTVHSRIRDLESHLLLNQDNDIEQLNWGPDVSGLDMVLLAANETFIVSTKRVLQLFDLQEIAEEFNACGAEFDDM
ncbi:DUF5677 domain-containing protein [Geobacter sp. DSM 9736]|uniref:DUF5677 domain-containing protein n=1 Tax=Geobacter sp. DSM 9736 TaxID=1277350 RepID=UPI000B511500|nr:DUF5677 domain-containing protein [Geobacter sp. DSM 9736]SNB44929.1 hypothetical protein SAMN06269301_0319 [Geobacter sp. DSM 9736]